MSNPTEPTTPLAERSNAGLEVGVQRSQLIGENVEVLQNGGLSFWPALSATLKVYDL